MELNAAKELILEYATSAFAGVFSNVSSEGNEGYAWKLLADYEAKKLSYNTDTFEGLMFTEQVIFAVEIIEYYVSTYELESQNSDFFKASNYIKSLCNCLITELLIYGDGGYSHLYIHRDNVNLLCSPDILKPRELISEALWEESFVGEGFIDREMLRKYLSERRFYSYPFLGKDEKANSSDVKNIEQSPPITADSTQISNYQDENVRPPKRALNAINVALTIAKYSVGEKNVGSYHPEYSSTKYVTPFLFAGKTIAMENTKKPQLWVKVSDLRSMPKSIKYQIYDATTKTANPYGRNSNLKAIKELAWDTVVKFKLTSLDDLYVILSHLLSYEQE